jgi:regulator of sirC expression with transglutaminase-like and TPR domain
MIAEPVVRAFVRVALSPEPDLAPAALMIARLEYPAIDANAYIDRLDVLGREAAACVAAATPDLSATPARVDPAAHARVVALNDYLFRDQQFSGNDTHYEDPRNSCLNEVLDRRTGIPLTLAIVYMEVARRAGVAAEGINFPGHFLIRCPTMQVLPDQEAGPRLLAGGWDDLIVDAFHGTIVAEHTCRDRLREYAGENAEWEPHLGRATKTQILIRMLVNLKRVYVKMRSFPQARNVTELLLALDPSATNEFRDRGLLAYQLNDYPAALRDLQTYLSLSAREGVDEDDREDHAQLWEQMKSIQRRVASLN